MDRKADYMISDRIIQIVNFLQKKKVTSYREIAENLNLKDRYVRYDIDRINDLLMDKNLPLIDKQAKGMLTFPESVNQGDIFETVDFVFMPEQRVSFILLIALFDTENLNLRKLSKDFEVSRSSIKNDLAVVTQMLKKYDLTLVYDTSYQLNGNEHKQNEIMIQQFKRYIYIYGRNRKHFNAYEEYAKQILKSAFEDTPIKAIITWIKEFLDDLHCVLTDDSFKWYVASIMVSIWCVVKNKSHPLENILEEHIEMEQYEHYMEDLQALVRKPLDAKKRSMIMSLLMYTSRYDGNKHNLPMLHTETIVQTLVHKMSKKMKLNFESDYILYDGLINHMSPLLGRILDNVEMSEEILSILSKDAYQVFEIVVKVIRDIEILQDIKNENEIGYLTIHFIASMKRLLDTKNKKILLVCGLGYGTTTLVRETLLSEYQVEITDTIPSYKLQSYTKWNEVDFVITTMKVEIECCRKLIQIQPIFTIEDYQKIDELGILRKNILSNYYAIKTKLDFLTKNDRLRVLEIIRNELGYSDIKIKKKIKYLSDLLAVDTIKIVNQVSSWQDAVTQSAGLLQASSAIDERYTQNIVDCMNKLGFYSVIDEQFALLHGSQNRGVHQTKISLLIVKEAVYFDDKKTNIVFCLASTDKKEHIPAVTGLLNLAKDTCFLEESQTYENEKEVYKQLLKYEKQLEELQNSYQ